MLGKEEMRGAAGREERVKDRGERESVKIVQIYPIKNRVHH